MMLQLPGMFSMSYKANIYFLDLVRYSLTFVMVWQNDLWKAGAMKTSVIIIREI